MSSAKKRKHAVVDKKICVACGACVKVCPRDAIAVCYGIYSVPNLEKCVGCGLCVKACPADAIVTEAAE